jgi:hypothetical protein
MANLIIKQEVRVGHITGKREVFAEIPHKLKLDAGIHEPGMVKRIFVLVILPQIVPDALSIAEALRN